MDAEPVEASRTAPFAHFDRLSVRQAVILFLSTISKIQINPFPFVNDPESSGKKVARWISQLFLILSNYKIPAPGSVF